MKRIIESVWDTYRHYGFSGIAAQFRARRFKQSEQQKYQAWIDKNRDSASAITKRLAANIRTPLISVILPVYNIDERWLRLCIDSVRSQVYENWELCIADDRSTVPHVRRILSEYAEKDERIKVVFREMNGHISAASNSALEMAKGEFCVLLDHDDELSNDALLWVANEIVEHPDVQMIYSDEDLIGKSDNRSDPKFKPDFSRDLLYSLNLITHLSAYRTDTLRAVGGFQLGTEGSQDYDLALRVLEAIDECQIRHIPRVLYHWRTLESSVAYNTDAKPYAHERARIAIRSHLERSGVVVDVEPTHLGLHRVRYPLPEPRPSVSLILFGDEPDATKVVFRNDYESDLIEISRVSTGESTADKLNAVAADATGEILLFVDQVLRPLSNDAISELVRLALQPKIGCVGGFVIDARGTIVSGGLVLGGESIINVAHAGFPEGFPGNIVRNLVVSNFSAVSLSVMAVRRYEFREAGGFDDRLSDPDLISADLCLRLMERGLRNVLTPYAKFRGDPVGERRSIGTAEREVFLSKWSKFIDNDPFANPNVSADGKFSIKQH